MENHKTCTRCKGSGWMVCTVCHGSCQQPDNPTMPCSYCDGTGVKPCTACLGRGYQVI